MDAIQTRVKTFCDVFSKIKWNVQANKNLSHKGISSLRADELLNSALSSEQGFQRAYDILLGAKQYDKSVYVIGNGGSAAVASHIVNDLVNQASISASTIHEPALLTCMANDYGFDQCYSTLLSKIARPGDVLIAISSSGGSKDIINAVDVVNDIGGKTISLSGFNDENPLRLLGDVNCWLDSSSYGIVEIGHLFILHALAEELGKIHE